MYCLAASFFFLILEVSFRSSLILSILYSIVDQCKTVKCKTGGHLSALRHIMHFFAQNIVYAHCTVYAF